MCGKKKIVRNIINKPTKLYLKKKLNFSNIATEINIVDKPTKFCFKKHISIFQMHIIN